MKRLPHHFLAGQGDERFGWLSVLPKFRRRFHLKCARHDQNQRKPEQNCGIDARSRLTFELSYCEIDPALTKKLFSRRLVGIVELQAQPRILSLVMLQDSRQVISQDRRWRGEAQQRALFAAQPVRQFVQPAKKRFGKRKQLPSGGRKRERTTLKQFQAEGSLEL